MTEKILWEASKEYTLQNGFRVKIDAIDRGGDCPIHGAFYNPRFDRWCQISFNLKGKDVHGAIGYDLVLPAMPRIKGECWIVVTHNGYGVTLFTYSKDAAKKYAQNNIIDGNNSAIVHVLYDVAEGEGL